MTGSLLPLELPPLALVVGGARSGKSAYAERLLYASTRPRRYIATAQAWDDEMRARIAQHQQDRGTDWVTVDAPRDLPAALATARADEVVLINSATL